MASLLVGLRVGWYVNHCPLHFDILMDFGVVTRNWYESTMRAQEPLQQVLENIAHPVRGLQEERHKVRELRLMQVVEAQ